MKTKLFAILLVGVIFISGCTEQKSSSEYELYVFGTLVGISLWQVSSEQEQKAISAIGEDFQRMHHDWHAWEPGPLVEINKMLAAGEQATVIPSLIPIIRESIRLSELSDGLFNPAMGSLLNVWGFQSSERPHGPPPPKEVLQAWLKASPGMDDLELKGNRLRSRNPAVQLDFGAFAKGYAVDLAIARLREFGIENAIINAGGDLRAIGAKGDKPWRVGVQHPQGQGVMAAIEVQGDEAVFTSGNYERYREHEGVRYTHILDPRTAMPVEGVTSVTVIHPNGGEADAAATALVVAGPEHWYEIARKMGVRYVMLVDDKGEIYMNPRMQERVEFKPGSEHTIHLSEPL